MSTKTAAPQTTVPLSTAARRLRLSWGSAYRLILTGALDGELVNGRWQISQTSLDRIAKERAQTGHVGQVAQ